MPRLTPIEPFARGTFLAEVEEVLWPTSLNFPQMAEGNTKPKQRRTGDPPSSKRPPLCIREGAAER